MNIFDISVKGEKKVLKMLKKMENPNKTFDSDVRKTAVRSHRELKDKTNKDTGTTARSWQLKKIADGIYVNFNDVRTDDKKHLIVNLLNYGRIAVKAKSGPFRGTKYIDKEKIRAKEQLKKLILKRIKKL